MKKLALVIAMFALAGVASANLLTNGDFSTADTNGWTAFNGTAVTDQDNSGNPLPQTGRSSVGGYGDFAGKLWGSYTGEWGVSGMFQAFSASEGETWTMTGDLMMLSNDAITADAFAVLKMAFKDSLGNEIYGQDLGQVNASSTADVWQNLSLSLAAPAGTASVEALALFFQPTAYTGAGAAYFDNVTMIPEPSSIALIGLAGGGLLFFRRKYKI